MDERYPTSWEIKTLTAAARPGQAPIAILPIGCTEQHGPFLPLETDTLIACGMAQTMADRFRNAGFPVQVLPAIAYSPTRSNISYPGTVSVGEQVFRDYLFAVIRSLLASEFGTIILLSGHGPADASLQELAFVAVDEQFRAATTPPKPVLPASLAQTSSELRHHFPDPLGRHADWREFLMVYQVLGTAYFTEERMRGLQAFQRDHEFNHSHPSAPGIPLEYRSTQGVIGNPLPEGRVDYPDMAQTAWTIIADRMFAELSSALASFPRAVGGDPHPG